MTPGQHTKPFTRTEWSLLAALLAVALACRLYVGINTTYITHPDENFDYLEQGFRLAFGYGTATWTYQLGLRNYLFPALIAGVMRLGALFGSSPDAYLNAVAVVMSLLSLSVVACAFVWGHRVGGTLAALVTGFVAAVWFE